MTRVLYFAYGSNLDADQLSDRCPSSRALFRARLPHHRIDFTYFSTHWAGGAADVLPHSDDEVWGVVYEMTANDLDRLDRFERGYDRVALHVEADGGQTHQVVSYTVRQKLSFRPTPVYLDKMLRWAIRWELPPPYLERLRRIAPSH